MKKSRGLFFIVLLFLGSACSSLDMAEIARQQKDSFAPLILVPEIEPNSMRLDVIRQKQSSLQDSLGIDENERYHPLGFDLGNGLFFDLNKNISLKVHELIGFDAEQNFKLQEISQQLIGKGDVDYELRNDSLWVKQSFFAKRLQYARSEQNDSISFFGKKRLKYAIVETDTSIVYRGRLFARNIIWKKGDHLFFLDKKMKRKKYELADGEVMLGDDYKLSLASDKTRLEIKKQGWMRDRTIYNIEKSGNTTYVYDRYGFGWKIVRNDNELLVFYGKKLFVKYSLVSHES